MGREQVRQPSCLALDMAGIRVAGLSTFRVSDRNPQTLFVRVLLQLRMVACHTLCMEGPCWPVFLQCPCSALEFILWSDFCTGNSKPWHLMARWEVYLACGQTEMRTVCVVIIKDMVIEQPWSKCVFV